MKWYVVLVTAAEIILAVLATLYVFHPRTVIVEKPFPTIVYKPSKPDTVYIKKYIQVQASPVEPTEKTPVSAQTEPTPQDTLVSEKTFGRSTAVGTLMSFVRIKSFCPVLLMEDSIYVDEGDQYAFDRIRKEIAAKNPPKSSKFGWGVAVGAAVASGIIITALAIQ
jgi:hypothetical protein